MHRCRHACQLLARGLAAQEAGIAGASERQQLAAAQSLWRAQWQSLSSSPQQPQRQHATSTAIRAAAGPDVDRLADAAAAVSSSDASGDDDAAALPSDAEASSEAETGAAAPDELLALVGGAYCNTLAIAAALRELAQGESIREATSALSDAPQTSFEVGRLATLANGACVARQGNTQVLATLACNAERTSFKRDANSAIPLEVDFRERQFTVGRIPTTFTRSEGPPAQRELLASRAIDRTLRPLFPANLTFDTQITANVLSADGLHDADVLAINAASAALAVSPIACGGPVGAVRVTVVDGQTHVGPPPADSAGSTAPALRLLVAGTRDRIVMLEAEGQQATEEDFILALAAAEPAVASLIAAQERLTARSQVKKREQARDMGPDLAGMRAVAAVARPLVCAALRETEDGKAGRALRLHAIKHLVTEKLRSVGRFRYENSRVRGSGCASPADLDAGLSAVVAETVRDMAVAEGLRPDGRGLSDLRPLHCELGAVPVVHGSALFQRGETQSLATATVATLSDKDSAGKAASTLVVHYTSPPFANNDVNRRTGGGPTRREVGHSELVRRALAPSLPLGSPTFPWEVRLNADTLTANGSSSMAAVCAGSLALAAAGLPAVGGLTAGVAVGMLTSRPLLAVDAAAPAEARPNGSSAGTSNAAASAPAGWFGSGSLGSSVKQELVVDLQGLEDAVGDMDFKLAGTRSGITAAQLDVKSPGVSGETVLSALAAARQAHSRILDFMESAAAAVADAPARLGSISIASSKIGRLIGTGGSTIKATEAQTGARFAIQDSGLVQIYAPQGLAAAEAAVKGVTGDSVQVGEKYGATVRRLMDYGAFVELTGCGGVQALLHISEMAVERVRAVEDVMKEGDELEVLVTGRDARGNVKLSRKALLDGSGGSSGGTQEQQQPPRQRRPAMQRSRTE